MSQVIKTSMEPSRAVKTLVCSLLSLQQSAFSLSIYYQSDVQVCVCVYVCVCDICLPFFLLSTIAIKKQEHTVNPAHFQPFNTTLKGGRMKQTANSVSSHRDC